MDVDRHSHGGAAGAVHINQNNFNWMRENGKWVNNNDQTYTAHMTVGVGETAQQRNNNKK